MNNVSVVYTPWTNLKKTADMDVGQIGFHKQKDVSIHQPLALKMLTAGIFCSFLQSTDPWRNQQESSHRFFSTSLAALSFGPSLCNWCNLSRSLCEELCQHYWLLIIQPLSITFTPASTSWTRGCVFPPVVASWWVGASACPQSLGFMIANQSSNSLLPSFYV